MAKRHGVVDGKVGKAKRRIFQEMRAPEAKEEQTFAGGRRKESGREGSRAQEPPQKGGDGKGEGEREGEREKDGSAAVDEASRQAGGYEGHERNGGGSGNFP